MKAMAEKDNGLLVATTCSIVTASWSLSDVADIVGAITPQSKICGATAP